jgi:hypothetical protein
VIDFHGGPTAKMGGVFAAVHESAIGKQTFAALQQFCR